MFLIQEKCMTSLGLSHTNCKAYLYSLNQKINFQKSFSTHQLFGNVVTCKWWDQIWLNEGFATWGEFLLPELLNITLDHEFHHLFNIKKTQNAFRHDSRQSTRPMTFETKTNSEISDRFDTIAYDKCKFNQHFNDLFTVNLI